MAEQMAGAYYDAVYEVVRMIPAGRITSYGAIADFLGLGSARMVGWALRNLRAMHGDVPAHRVVNASGVLTGRNNFGGEGVMQALLEAEGVKVRNNRVVGFERLHWHPAEMAR